MGSELVNESTEKKHLPGDRRCTIRRPLFEPVGDVLDVSRTRHFFGLSRVESFEDEEFTDRLVILLGVLLVDVLTQVANSMSPFLYSPIVRSRFPPSPITAAVTSPGMGIFMTLGAHQSGKPSLENSIDYHVFADAIADPEGFVLIFGGHP